MTTHVTQFFAERREVNFLLTEIREKESCFLYISRGETLEPLTAPPDPEARRVFVGTGLQGEEALKGGGGAPGKWGLVLLDLPFYREGVLTMTVLSSRTDWSEDGKRRQSAAAGRLHKRIESLLTEYLKFPVWARNRQTGRWERYSRIGYTKGAVNFVEKGGSLRQEGVANVEFLLASPSH